MQNDNPSIKTQTNSLMVRLAEKFGVDPVKLRNCLTNQVFRQADGKIPSNEELMVLLLVCENYGLNPFNREVYAFRGKGGDIVPIVSLDGWARIVRSQPDFDGMSFRFSETSVSVPGYPAELPEFVECTMRLKGISSPVVIQEFMLECYQERSPVWKKWPRRMLRTRAFIQCARLAFSLTGLYDEGDAYSDDGFTGKLTLGAVEGNLPSKAPVQALPLDRAKLDVMLDKLTRLAVTCGNGWTRAEQWIDANLSGEDRLYAHGYIRRVQSPKVEEAAASSVSDVQDPVTEASESGDGHEDH